MASPEKGLALLPPEPDKTLSVRAWAVAVLAVLLVLGVAAITTTRRSATDKGELKAADAYADRLPIQGVELFEATNGTGGKATYMDGHITNAGSKTLTAALVQVTFATGDGSPPSRQILPLALIRTRVPYVDLQPVVAAPILPSQEREFRLIFESVPSNWDVKPPAIQVVHAELK